MQVKVQRVFGSLDDIQIRYQTVSGTAVGGVDYKPVENGAITMNSGQTSAEIYIQVRKILYCT